MTADDFYLNVNGDIVEISAKDCSMHVDMEVYYEDFIDALGTDECIREWVLEKMRDICINNWQLGNITDVIKDRFLMMLEAMR